MGVSRSLPCQHLPNRTSGMRGGGGREGGERRAEFLLYAMLSTRSPVHASSAAAEGQGASALGAVEARAMASALCSEFMSPGVSS